MNITQSHMTAIRTRYIGPTNTRGARIKANAGMGRTVTIGYPHDAPRHEAHARAAEALCVKMGWDGAMLEGEFDDGGHVFVFVPHGAALVNKP